MLLDNYPFLRVLFFYILGIIFYTEYNFNLPLASLIFLTLGLLLCSVFLSNPFFKNISLFGVFFALALTSMSYRDLRHTNVNTGVAIWEVKLENEAIKEYYYGKIISRTINGVTTSQDGYLLLGKDTTMAITGSLLFSGEVLPINNSNKTLFKAKDYYSSFGIYYRCYLNSSKILLLSRDTTSTTSIFKRFRNYISSKIENNPTLSINSKSLLLALILGDKKSLSPHITALFRETGVSHILALSGFHLGLLFVIISFILSKLQSIFTIKRTGISFKLLSFILINSLIWYYTLTAYSSPSLLRATIMITFGSLYYLFYSKRDNIINITLLTFFILLVINPYNLYNLSFLLSFSALLGILIFTPIIKRGTDSKLHLPYLSNIIAVTLSAQIGTLPFILYFFKGVALFSVISNIVLTPIISIYLPIGFLIIFLPISSFTFITNCLSFIENLLTIIMLYVLELISKIPFKTVLFPTFSKIELFLLTLFFIFFFLSYKPQRRKLVYIWLFILFIFITIRSISR